MNREFLERTIRGSIQAHPKFARWTNPEKDTFAEGLAAEIVNNHEAGVLGQRQVEERRRSAGDWR